MARQLIDSLSAGWEPEAYSDEYRDALMQIVEAKVKGEEIEVVEPEPTAKVVDLMEALKASVAAAKKGEEPSAARASGDGGSKSSGGGAAKKTATKKTAAKKTSAKSTKKTAARKKAVGE
jgi:DNA end-binding protein Ku